MHGDNTNIDNWEKVSMFHSLQCSEPLLVVVSQQLVQEVQGLRTNQVLILTVDKPLPPFPRMSP